MDGFNPVHKDASSVLELQTASPSKKGRLYISSLPTNGINQTLQNSNDSPVKPCHLLGLPRELRNMIYEHALSCIVVVADSAAELSAYNNIQEACGVASALPRTCKQISWECYGMFSISSIIRHDNATLRRWSTVTSDALLALTCAVKAHHGKRRRQSDPFVKKYHGSYHVDTQINIWANLTRSFFDQVPDATSYFDFKLETGSVARFSLTLDESSTFVEVLSTGLMSNGKPASLSDVDRERLDTLTWFMEGYVECTWETMHEVWEKWARRNHKGETTRMRM